MSSRRRTATSITALTCGAALLGGFAGTGVARARDSGGEGDLAGKSAEQISELARKELLAATSLRLRTSTSVDATRLDITMNRSGDCTGAISKGRYGKVELIKHGRQIWLKPDDAFWKGQLSADAAASVIARVKGRYLHGTTDDPLPASIAAACDLAAFQKQTAGSGSPESPTPTPPGASPQPKLTLSKGRPTVQEGTRVLPILKTRGGARQTLYVAIDGKHVPRRLTAEVDHQTATILLSDYGAHVSPKTPTAARSMEISEVEDQLPGAKPPSQKT
ncbi:hypothetical protein [Streptomyces sp. NPDC014733]|uniref:hypothetical protein n=1 Tax=Streptomyces sp. NPDC014733 TaxID=3364885 RepID=UPI0036F6262C